MQRGCGNWHAASRRCMTEGVDGESEGDEVREKGGENDKDSGGVEDDQVS